MLLVPSFTIVEGSLLRLGEFDNLYFSNTGTAIDSLLSAIPAAGVGSSLYLERDDIRGSSTCDSVLMSLCYLDNNLG